jgi:hypothetical protein
MTTDFQGAESRTSLLCGAGAEAAVGHGQEHYRDQSFNDPGGEDQANAEAAPFDQGVSDQMHFIHGITRELMDGKGQGAGCEGGKQHGLKLNSAEQGDWIDWGVGCRVWEWLEQKPGT